MKKTTVKLFALPILIFLISACEDVIQIDLNSSNPATVIEAKIYDMPDSNGFYNRIDISKSTNYFQPGNYPKIDDARVSVTDNDGNRYDFNGLGNGVYNCPTLKSELGLSYRIDVSIGNKSFSATSSVNDKIKIDSLYIESRTMPGKKVYFVHVLFKDNPDKVNYARIFLFINGVKQPNYRAYSDRLTNGNDVELQLFAGENVTWGDLIKVEIDSIDKAVFEYFKTLVNVQANRSNSNGQVAPANPLTNWNNNALGYFSVQAVDVDSLTVGFSTK